MKSFSCIAILSSILLAVTSCEQHRWENEVEVIKEPVYDVNSKPVMVKNENGELVHLHKEAIAVKETGSKSFFYDEHAEAKLKDKQRGVEADH